MTKAKPDQEPARNPIEAVDPPQVEDVPNPLPVSPIQDLPEAAEEPQRGPAPKRAK